MGTTDVVRQTREQVVASASSTGSGPPTVFDLIRKQQGAIETALPKHLSGDRFSRIAVTTLRTTPALARCDAMSFIGALMVSAQLGLEPGGPLGQAFLVPFGNQVQFIIGYRGIIELARRSGQLSSIEAHEVCENDEFSYSYGLDDHLTHVPVLKGERGDAYAFYAIAKFKDGGHAFVVLSKDEVDKHRARSKTGRNGPWSTDYDAMARKTCIRALAPYLPLSPELERAIRGDERVYRQVEPDLIDTPAIEDDPPTELGAGDDPGPAAADDPGRPFDEPKSE